MLAGRATSILSERRGLSPLLTAPAGHPGDEAVASVSRDTPSETHSVSSRHRYAHEARSVKGARLRKKLLDAALVLIADGNLRPSLSQITSRAGVRTNAVNEQFGYLHLLFRQLVRERSLDVLVALRLPGAQPESERIELAWMILAGCRPNKIGTLA